MYLDVSYFLIVSLTQSIDSVTQIGRRLLDVIAIKDEDILKHRGVDALQYLSFQRYIIYFLILLTTICLLVILPINLHGDMSKSRFICNNLS